MVIIPGQGGSCINKLPCSLAFYSYDVLAKPEVSCAWPFFLDSAMDQEFNAGCRQLIVDHHKWIDQLLGCETRLPCVFGDVLQQMNTDPIKPGDCFQTKLKIASSLELQTHQICHSHGAQPCPIDQYVDLDISGLPCPDNSKANMNRKFEEGESGLVYIVWAKKHRRLETPLLILENTPDPRHIQGRACHRVVSEKG